jgi:hypothetical protein
MFWALARAGLVLELPKSLAVTRNFFFMVYDQNYHNCSTLRRPPKSLLIIKFLSNPIMRQFEKVNVPLKLFSWHYFGNLLCFSHHSTILQPNNFIMDWKIVKGKKFWRNILFFKLSHNRVRYRQSIVDCLCLQVNWWNIAQFFFKSYVILVKSAHFRRSQYGIVIGIGFPNTGKPVSVKPVLETLVTCI